MAEGEARQQRVPLAELSRLARRDAVLDAAGDLMRAHGWNKVRMADVADRAGISRQTLYVDFGSRDGLALHAVLREVDRFLDAVQDAITAHAEDAQAAAGAAFEAFLGAVATNPLLLALVINDNNETLLPLLTVRGAPILESASNRLASIIHATWPTAEKDDAAALSECIIRLAISVATLPRDVPQVNAKTIAVLLGPFARTMTNSGPATS
jgi:AcrR family transcriptional regulator